MLILYLAVKLNSLKYKLHILCAF